MMSSVNSIKLVLPEYLGISFIYIWGIILAPKQTSVELLVWLFAWCIASIVYTNWFKEVEPNATLLGWKLLNDKLI